MELRELLSVGMGQELRGDDAAGVLVADHLARLLVNQPDRLVINGGAAPENFTGPLRRFSPALVILVDAAQMGGQPGEIRWIEADQLDGFTGSTHTLPPKVLASFLKAEIGCQVELIKISGGYGVWRPGSSSGQAGGGRIGAGDYRNTR